MKKFFYLLMLASVCQLVACNDNNKDDSTGGSVSSSAISIKVGETTTIDVDGDINSTSTNNDFIATIDAAAKVTGIHVGDTKVTVNKKSISVEVTGEYTLGHDPLVDWSAKESTVKKYETDGILVYDGNSLLSYAYTDGGIVLSSAYQFYNSKLVDVAITVLEDDYSALKNYLDERYDISWGSNNTGSGYNAYKASNATVRCIVTKETASGITMYVAEFRNTSVNFAN